MKKKTKIWIFVIIVTLTSPWWVIWSYLGSMTIYGKIDEIVYKPTTQFDSQRWKAKNLKYRYSVLGTVSQIVITQGIPEDSVRQLLGSPDSIDGKGSWQYETKRPGWRLIDFSGGGLLIEFDNERIVRSATNNTWID